VLGQALALELGLEPAPGPEPVLGQALVRHSQQQSSRSSESPLPPKLISFSFLSIYLLKY
jgi:hypothetical protein